MASCWQPLNLIGYVSVPSINQRKAFGTHAGFFMRLCQKVLNKRRWRQSRTWAKLQSDWLCIDSFYQSTEGPWNTCRGFMRLCRKVLNKRWRQSQTGCPHCQSTARALQTNKWNSARTSQPTMSALERCLPYGGVHFERVDCIFLTIIIRPLTRSVSITFGGWFKWELHPRGMTSI